VRSATANGLLMLAELPDGGDGFADGRVGTVQRFTHHGDQVRHADAIAGEVLDAGTNEELAERVEMADASLQLTMVSVCFEDDRDHHDRLERVIVV
jgi:hypothetical protein